MVAENGGWRRSGSLKVGVLAMIRRLSWCFGQRRCKEWWPKSITEERRRMLQRWEGGRNDDYFRYGGRRLVVLEMHGGTDDEKVNERLLAADEAAVREKEERAVEGWRGREEKWKQGNGWFFAIFGSNFLHAQAMKSTLIYRRRMRVILST